MSGVWRSSRKKANPAKKEDIVDLGSKFGMSFGSDSDSSDAEFAPENETIDSDDSHEFLGDDENSSSQPEGGTTKAAASTNIASTKSQDSDQDESMETETTAAASGEREADKENGEVEQEEMETTTTLTDAEGASSGKEREEGEEEKKEGEGEKAKPQEKEEPEYNPLIVRRSNRAIKPTKDIDLYLLGAQFGIDVEGSDADSSDQEFAPAVESDPESVSVSSDEGGRGAKDINDEGEQANQSDEDAASQSVSEFSSVVQGTQLTAKAIDIPLCCVCLEDSTDGGDIVECDHCGISVHEGCYGVPEEDGVDDGRSSLSSFTTVPWFCDACKAGIDPTKCACELCPNIGGLFKQTINGRWVHMVCSLYTPGIEYVEPSMLGGITLDHLPSTKWGSKPCLLCEMDQYSKTGICIGCDAGLCKSVFHVTCAQKHGLLCEVDSDDEDKELCEPFFAHCKAHSIKEIAKRKRRDYLTVMTKQKMFSFDGNDERVQHYLALARKEYTTFFKKMQDYYQPDQRSKREQRLLHTVPNALRRLTEKARLLGYEVEVGMAGSTEARRKIAPNLTIEFVNYFNERLVRMKSIHEQISSLESSNKELKEEEGKLKEQLSKVERELSMLRSEVSKSESQANNIYLNLSKLYSDWELGLPDSLKEEQKSKEEQIVDTPTCDICKKSQDSHLMALCDTCNKYYHIGCLDPPLSKVPKKSAKWGWQCQRCCISSGDELMPTIADFDEPASRSGRKIQRPKPLVYQDEQVKKKTKTKKKSKPKKS